MTPEQIQYVREWAKSGNEARPPNEVSAIIPLCIVVFPTRDYSVILNSVGLTIARLADALEQACETAEEYSEETGWHESIGGSGRIRLMRANRKELLG